MNRTNMKRIGIVLAVLCCVSLSACQKEQFVQHIKSCVDCVSCDDWSWSNGVGSAAYGGACTFRVLEDGELKMRYSVDWLGKLEVTGGASFSCDDATQASGASYDCFKRFTTSVKKDTYITISGRECKVKNVRIVCHGRAGEDEGDDF